MKLPAAVTVGRDVMARKVAEETVLLDLASGTYFGLNPVGSRVWELLGAGRAPAEIVEVLLAEYDVQRADLESDLARLFAELAAKGLVTAREAV